MNDKTAVGVHWSFWLIGVVALIWNAMGCMNFIMQMNPEAVAGFPDSHRAIIEGRPIWATAGFALGVFGGTLGCVLLLLRKFAANYAFIGSLVGVVVTMGHTLSVDARFTPFEIGLMITMPLLVAGFLVWYSQWAEQQDWLT